ncbi:hypothetical protein KIH74_05760 [Kineosporia sp. J2-2]|uniref:Uncharacterized protein n=1 Tax=Kineosporia corallincola TaxID=2835133 RepID=A0ABS5TBH6_9ACTN|nr:hypothetical protein [Kineosporia corallincola]MBT0768420.1 hypothetical protein [Kineosporia corallincola]
MRLNSLRTAGTGVVLAAVATIGVATASSASADTVLDQWYPTAYDCQYAGNVYAQQGLISGFSCNPGNGGYILTGWHW